MFDDNQTKNSNLPPNNLPTEEPIDIFSGVEENNNSLGKTSAVSTPDALSYGLLKKKELTAANVVNNPTSEAEILNQEPVYDLSKPILGKVLLVMLIIVVIGGLVLGGWWLYDKLTQKDSSSSQTANQNTMSVASTSEISKADSSISATTTAINLVAATTTKTTSTDLSNRNNSDNILFGEAVDTDKDGLDDIREKQLGTDVSKVDTDNDGLSDGDEVLIWNANPLKADTDDDGYSDGLEVKSGYNPAGAGKLFNLPKSSTTTVATTSAN